MPRNIVICCDGTSNDVTCDSTNVLRLYRSLERSSDQLAYYDPGVGTVADPTKLSWLSRQISCYLDMGIGHSVREHVCGAYRFLCENYQDGDRIYLFGFSRGAYTVRALAGMVHFLGLARPELVGLDRLAWTIFADDNKSLPTGKRFESGARFRKSFGIESQPRIHFVGVWDTVSAFGFIWDLRTVPFTSNNPSIDHVRHAVSIDENRAMFQANLFHPRADSQHVSFRELWFAGSHSDVGGGYPEKESGLSKITLEWMYSEAEANHCRFLPSQKLRFLGGGEDKSKADAKSIAHKPIVGYWHLMEFLPRKQWDYISQQMRWCLPNFYRKRDVPAHALIHRSVKEKQEVDLTYMPENLPTSPEYCG